MTALLELRRQLQILRRRRWQIRWGGAALILGAVLLTALATVFLIDVWLDTSVLQRSTLLAITLFLLAWSIHRFCWSLFDQHDDDAELALQIQHHHQIDSDLVAALQFETPDAINWGSRDLQFAVVQHAA